MHRADYGSYVNPYIFGGWYCVGEQYCDRAICWFAKHLVSFTITACTWFLTYSAVGRLDASSKYTSIYGNVSLVQSVYLLRSPLIGFGRGIWGRFAVSYLKFWPGSWKRITESDNSYFPLLEDTIHVIWRKNQAAGICGSQWSLMSPTIKLISNLWQYGTPWNTVTRKIIK